MTRACQRNIPSPDVSRHLPAELLESIFIRIARDSYTNKIYIYATPGPARPSWVKVSYVCRYWRDVALNCPTLWSYVPATSQRWTEELFARSQMAPLKICTMVTSLRPEQKAQMLSIVERVMNQLQRIQKFHLLGLGVVDQEICYQILSKFLFTRLPCLQHLELSHLELSHFGLLERKPWLSFEGNTPALRTLVLEHCWIPSYALGPNVLTTLRLFDVAYENSMAGFLAMLRRMPHLVRLSVDNALPSARDFLSDGELQATPMISLPHLSNVSITEAPLSAITALVSCVDIPLRAQVHLEARLENAFEDDMSTIDDYVYLASLVGQRISRSEFRSLIIGSSGPNSIALAFSTSEHVECYSLDSLFSIGPDDNVLFKVIFVDGGPTDEPILTGACTSQIPLTDIQSVYFLGSSLEPELWRDILASLSGVWHIRFSQDAMPNITSMLSLPSHHLSSSWQDDHADSNQGNIFLPKLEELELYQTTLKDVRGGRDPDPYVADLQDLYDAIATRKETRCRLTIKECRLLSRRRVPLESVGWWEGDQFRVTSKV